MRYPALEKLEIIRLIERSHLPVRWTLDKLGIPATTFTDGMTDIEPLARLDLRTAPVARAGYGTVSRTMSAGRSWS